MVESKLTYEECRRQRLEENKKRMEELNLTNLSHSLKKNTNTHTPSPLKKRSRNPQQESDQVRRSSRVANKPHPNYKDDVVVLPFMTRRRSYPGRNLLNRVFASDKERTYAIERAEELQSGLDPQYPSFVKPMLQSHVTGCFWLGLPVYFCKNHLPTNDETIILVDEEGNESPTKYLPRKTGLSGGWRGFSLEHGLVDGDALVFHLVKPTTFKVYIIRAYELEDNEDKDDKDKNEDSGVTPLSSVVKRTRANNGDKDGKDKNEDSGVTPLSSVVKRTRANNGDKDGKDKNEDSGVTPLSSVVKRTRANNGDKDGKDKNEDSGVTPLSSVVKRTRANNGDKYGKDKNEDSGVTPLSSVVKRTRANNGDKDGKDKNEDSGVAQLSSVAKRTRSSKK